MDGVLAVCRQSGRMTAELKIIRGTLNALLPVMEGGWVTDELRQIIDNIDDVLAEEPADVPRSTEGV